MTESDARDTLFVRAWETAPPGSVDWSEDDRAWASRAAAEVEGERAPTEAFIARRARLAIERLAGRDARVGRARLSLAWRPWVGWALGVAAFALGAATDAIGPSQQVNVLAPPLLALMLWNLAVYAAIALRALSPRLGAGPLSRLIARATHAGVAGRRDAGQDRAGASTRAALARFSADWARASARLNGSRVARVLHVAAIAFAAGALAGLYVRGLALEYRAGWESTFLDAPAIHAVLSLVLGPASALTGIGLPDEARLQAIRFPASPGEPAGPWIHLHAVTVALVVLLPRLALALWNLAVERRLAASFPLALDDAYFTALARAHRGEVALAVVVPYNHDPSSQAAAALRALACATLGAGARAEIAPTVPYGEEASAGASVALVSASKPASLTLALLSATATPEAETHGAFVDALASALPPGAELAVIVDESAFVTRFGTDATATRRREERRQAWRGALASREVDPVFVDLERDAPASAGAALRQAIDRRAHGAAIA